jgi:hypothetical protein
VFVRSLLGILGTGSRLDLLAQRLVEFGLQSVPMLQEFRMCGGKLAPLEIRDGRAHALQQGIDGVGEGSDRRLHYQALRGTQSIGDPWIEDAGLTGHGPELSGEI